MGKRWSCPIFEKVSRNTWASYQMFQKPSSLHSLTSTCQIRKTNTCLSHSLVWLPPKYSRLLAGDYSGQSAVEVIFYSLARKTVCLPYSLQRQWSKLPFSSHLCLNVVPNRMIQLEMDLEIKLNLLWFGHHFSFMAFIFPLFWIVGSPTNWSSTFYLRMKLLVGIKCIALGRSVWILKQDLAYRGSGQHWAVPAEDRCPALLPVTTEGKKVRRGLSYSNSNTNLETVMQKHLPRLTDSHFTHKRKPMWAICFPLFKFFIYSF